MTGLKSIVAIVLSITLASVVIIAVLDNTDESSNDLYVFCIVGQSNGVGTYNYGGNLTTVREDVPLVSDTGPYYYGLGSPITYEHFGSSLEPYIAESDINPMIRGGVWTVYGLEPSLGSKFSENINGKCLIINVSRGGVSIESYLEGNDSCKRATAILDDALSKASKDYVLHMESIFWLQGERDKSMNVDDYKSYFLEVWEYFKDRYEFKNIVIAQTRDSDGGNASVAQEELSGVGEIRMGTTIANSFTVANGLMYSDNVHYSQKGKDIVGSELMDYWVRNLYSAESHSLGLVGHLIVVVIAIIGVGGFIAIQKSGLRMGTRGE